MFSLNVPVSSEVARLASGLAATLRDADVRDRHGLVVKRLGDDSFPLVASRARDALSGTPPFAVRTTGVELFENPSTGSAPVAYLAVESPGLREVHARLCDAFDPVADIEGEDYTPHVTIARGGDAGRLAGREIEPVEWTVERLEFWDAAHREVVETVALPA